MTLPASGEIAVNQINTEIGQAPNFSSSLNFLNEQVKPSQKPATPYMSAFYGMTYFQNTTEGNCANGNCTSDCNCGDLQCTNCYIASEVNCTNCDPQPYLQTGTNCACVYNCNTGETTYNCNCNCNCNCFWSDDRLKTRKGSIENALDLVDQLEGFYYEGNQTAIALGLNPKLDAGVSAQQVEKVFPTALGQNFQGTDIKQVRYERLVPLLIEAVKQLRRELEETRRNNA